MGGFHHVARKERRRDSRPGWRLYSVSGLDAVELHLKNGDIRRIGTDDPKGLAAALNASG